MTTEPVHYPCHQYAPCEACIAMKEMAEEIPYPFLDISPPLLCTHCQDNLYRAQYYEYYPY